MRKVLLFLCSGFEIYEASVFIDILGWNLEEGDGTTSINTCGLKREIASSFNQKIIADLIFDEVNIDDYEALAIPGGFEKYGFYNDSYDEKFLELIRAFYKRNKVIASVCTGALPIGKSGILKDKKGTTYSSRQDQLKELGVVIQNDPIVFDDSIITSRNPGTAADVAFMLLELLTSKQNADHVKELMGF
jgi:protein deglycase